MEAEELQITPNHPPDGSGGATGEAAASTVDGVGAGAAGDAQTADDGSETGSKGERGIESTTN